MATPVSRTVPSNPNSSSQTTSRRDWGNLKTGEPGSGFRGISRGRGGRGNGGKGGRGGHPSNNSNQKGGSHSDTADSTPSLSPRVSSISRKPPTALTSNDALEKAINSSTGHAGRPKPGSRKQPRGVPVAVVTPSSPSSTSHTAPPTPSRSANRRRRAQSGKGSTTATDLLPIKNQKLRGGSTPASQLVMRKDIPPHLTAAHEAERRHDIDAFVERVRAVAMAENRPTTPGSHIDWAGDEDDSLPDLDDWGVTTTHTNATHNDDESEAISPILADTLKPLPEPNSEVPEEEEQEMETYDDQPKRAMESFRPSPVGAATVPSEKTSEQCTPTPEESSSFAISEERPPLHPSLPPKPVTAMENLRARGRSISKPSNFPPKSKASVAVSGEEPLTTNTEGLSESIHAPSAEDRSLLERVSSASSSERGLGASIHAPVPSLPESQSAPSLLSSHSPSTGPHTHSRSQTEGRPGIHTAPPGIISQRHGRSGASSPLGKHVYSHSRNHSTPAGGAGSRPPQATRPVITGEAISRLARTIGGLGPTPRTQSIPVTKDSTISS